MTEIFNQSFNKRRNDSDRKNNNNSNSNIRSRGGGTVKEIFRNIKRSVVKFKNFHVHSPVVRFFEHTLGYLMVWLFFYLQIRFQLITIKVPNSTMVGFDPLQAHIGRP